MSFAAGKRLDVIITIMKTVQCYVSCSPGMRKVGVQNFFVRSAREIVLSPAKPWRRPCQGETVKVKFVYNRLMDENGGQPNQISHHLQKNMLLSGPVYTTVYM